MAMIGRNAAVAEVGKHRHQVEGPVAFAAWLGVHAMLLSGAHSKTDAFMTWAWDYFDRDHAATVEASATPHRIAWGDDDEDVPHITVEADPDPSTARRQHRLRRTPWPTTTTSSSWARERAVARWRTGSRPPGSGSWCWSAATGCRARSENWDAEAVFVDNRYVSTDTWYDKDGKAFQPQVHYFVGGATKFYGAALYRLRERDFGELKHHGGISPGLADRLRRAGAVLHPGRAAVPGPRRPRGGPDRAARVGAVPVSRRSRTSRASSSCSTTWPRPVCIRSTPRAGSCSTRAEPAFSACIRCATCDGFPCLVHAKSDADVIAMRPALRHDNVTLLRNARVRRLETDPSGRTVTAVVADVDGMEQRFTGDVVVVSAGAVNSAKLLLASANDRHPNGLANGSDQVGRNYVFHNSRAFLAVSTEKNDTRFQKTLGLNDYYFGDADFEYPMGNLQMVGKSSAPMYRGEKPIEAGLAPTFAARRRRRARRRLLAVGRGPARSREPGHARRGRQRRPELHAATTRSRWSSSTTGSRSTSATWACTRTT